MRINPAEVQKKRLRQHAAAFTLVELLTVFVIIGLLVTFASIGIRGALGSHRISTALGTVRHDIGWASIEASKSNLPVHMRFYKFQNELEGPEGAQFQAYQFLVVDSRNSKMKPLTQIERLPEGVVLHPDPTYTSIISLGEKAPVESPIADPELNIPSYTYVEFQFKPDGSTDLPADVKWSLTLVPSNRLIDGNNELPKNYRTIVINPYTSATKAY